MIPTKTEVKAEVNRIIGNLVDIALDDFGLNVSDLKCEVDFREKSRCYGRAGINNMAKPVMTLFLGNVIRHQVVQFTEYKSLAKYRAMAGFKTTDWKLWLEALVIHEFSHVVQYASKYRLNVKNASNFEARFGRFEGNHSKFFQAIYSYLRKDLNTRITPIYLRPAANFEGEPLYVVKRQVKVRITESFPFQGTKIKYKGEIYEIKEMMPRNHKYPYIGITADGKRLKMSALHINHMKIA